MVILNILGQIEKTYISTKLGLYISNIPDSENTIWGNWQEEIKETLLVAFETNKLEANKYIGKIDNGSKNIFINRVIEEAKDILFLQDEPEERIIDKYIDFLSKNMIIIDIDYNYSSIPKGENNYNCFDGGSCEEEPVDKLLTFLYFICGGIGNKNKIPHCIYSTSLRKEHEYRYLFSGTTEITNQILTLKKLGKQLDDFLLTEKDYFQLDYLCNALFEFGSNENNTYHYMKLYSLCALFLEKGKDQELDFKLARFMDLPFPFSEREDMAKIMRKLRNKIAHGDFEKVNPILEEYAQKYMDGKFWFDYFEYTRPAWVLLHMSCILEDILRSLLNLMLNDRDKLREIKNMRKEVYNN